MQILHLTQSPLFLFLEDRNLPMSLLFAVPVLSPTCNTKRNAFP